MRQLLLIGIVFMVSGCALANPPETKFMVRVTDVETGQPITNAIVWSTFTQKRDPWGTGVGKSNRVKIPVDQSGEAVLSGFTIQTGEGGTAFADGYYADVSSFRFTGKNVALNRWNPWNPTIKVKMRPKKNPIPMIQRRVERKQIPSFEGLVGFDLKKADWISPYGKGQVSDFSFTVSTNIAPKKGVHYILSFPNKKDGIQKYMPPQDLRSSFVWPYEAPSDGYESGLDKYFIFHFPKVDGPPFHNVKDDKDVNYIFRTRTQLDDEGKIVAACYGRIKGEIRVSSKGEVYFSYWFNPVPNERSLEYNGENLLKK